MFKSNLKTECKKAYFNKEDGDDIDAAAIACGESTAHFLREAALLRLKDIRASSNHNVIYFTPPGR